MPQSTRVTRTQVELGEAADFVTVLEEVYVESDRSVANVGHREGRGYRLRRHRFRRGELEVRNVGPFRPINPD